MNEKDTRFEAWHAHRVGLSGGQSLGGKGVKPGKGWTYGAGPGKGKTEDQLMQESIAQWNAMNESQRTAAHTSITPARQPAAVTSPRATAAPSATVDPQAAEDARVGQGLGQSGAYVKMMRERAHPPDGSPASINDAKGVRKPATIGGQSMKAWITENKARQAAEVAAAPTTPGTTPAMRAQQDIAAAGRMRTGQAPPTYPAAAAPASSVAGATKPPAAAPATAPDLRPKAPVTMSAPLRPDQLVNPRDVGRVAVTEAMNHGKRLFVAPGAPAPGATAPAPSLPTTPGPVTAPGSVATAMDQQVNAGTYAGDAVARRSTQGFGVMKPEPAPNIADPEGNIAGAMNRAWKARGSKPTISAIARAAGQP